jgi:hypothetical protein
MRASSVLLARINLLRIAILRALGDEESRPGAWGPDVTCVRILREALAEDDRQAEVP